MITFYPDIKLVHIAAAMISGSFFGLRAMALLAGMRWPRMAPVRYLSYTVDTVLLTAAFMLLTILPKALYANGWLLVKLCFVAAYVVLGILAFKPKRRATARRAGGGRGPVLPAGLLHRPRPPSAGRVLSADGLNGPGVHHGRKRTGVARSLLAGMRTVAGMLGSGRCLDRDAGDAAGTGSRRRLRPTAALAGAYGRLRVRERAGLAVAARGSGVAAARSDSSDESAST